MHFLFIQKLPWNVLTEEQVGDESCICAVIKKKKTPPEEVAGGKKFRMSE